MSKYSVIDVHIILMRIGGVFLLFRSFLSAVMYLIFHLILESAVQVNRCALVSVSPHKQQEDDG